jgi:K+-sensing histidine kinase KdpD
VSEIRRYVMALLFVAAACVASLFLQRFFAYPFLFLIFAAVMASAWFGGTSPGFFAVFLSTVAVDYYFVPPFHSFAVNATDTAYFVAFVVSALAASWVSSSKRSSEEALLEARDHLEARVAERTGELQKTIA